MRGMAVAKLTARQERFAHEYMMSGNGYHSAINAGYSKNGAEVTASQLLRNPNVSELINKLRAQRSATTKIDAAWLLSRLSEEATADVQDIYNEDGSIKPMKDWPLIWRQGLVAGITTQVVIDEVGIPKVVIGKVKISDRAQRLAMIGKHVSVNAFQDIVKHDVTDGLADRLARARAKLRGEK